jgi:hypothetical protein
LHFYRLPSSRRTIGSNQLVVMKEELKLAICIRTTSQSVVVEVQIVVLFIGHPHKHADYPTGFEPGPIFYNQCARWQCDIFAVI